MSGKACQPGDWVLVLRPQRDPRDHVGRPLPADPLYRIKTLAKALGRAFGFSMVEVVPGEDPKASQKVLTARSHKARWLSSPVGSITKPVSRPAFHEERAEKAA